MLAPGSKLGPYEIIAALGAGGMGEVYEARDSNLGRKVAIKLLPPAFSSSGDRLQRFEQEARSASMLNHPNIVTIYELGHDGASHYIAMELVEGTTLRDLLAAGPLPMRRVIEVATQVADGLTKAHEAGITHRDLKPENLIVSRDGFTKILDFGLAKLIPAAGEKSDVNTTFASLTEFGQVLGTAGYMSPEQAEGRPLDFRSDQFSLGLVLYEMVTGKRAFHRNTAAETMVAILRETATPIAALNPDAPAPLCWVIERCLAKDPEKRYVTTRDLARELAAIRERVAEKPIVRAERRPSNLPIQRTGLVGRDNAVAAARDLLVRPEVRMVTVTGPGGIGKTRLAVEVASGLVDDFPGGIHFVPLSPLRDPALIASAIVQTLEIRETGGRSSLEILKEYLQRSSGAPILLLLDNFEHLIKAASTVADLLVMAPHLKILVTSRAALHVYGEHEFPVTPLELPDVRSLPAIEVLSRCPSVALFLQRAVAAKPGFELNQENAPAVTEICARLDGLPLAIELAAARIKVLSPSAMLARLASRLQLLTGGARDLPERQQTLRAAMDWSYELLSPPEQTLFRRLSVFSGGCNLEGAEAVCDTKADLNLDLLDGMASMVDKSLVRQVEQANGEPRFVMLETVREYALERLKASGEEALIRRAHAAYCLVLGEEPQQQQGGAQTADPLQHVALEHDNLRAAMEWLIETGDADWGLRLGAALFLFWETREYLTEGRDALGKLLRLPAAASPTRNRSRVLFAAGVLATEQGDYASADSLIAESLAIAQASNDPHGAAVSLNALAVNARDRGEIPRARALFEESLALWRQSGDPQAEARALSNLASVVRLQGDSARARLLYAECLSLFAALGDRTGVAWSMNSQGDLARDQGEAAEARRLYEQGLAIFRELGDHWGIAGTLADLGILARDAGDFPGAEARFRESLRIFQDLDHKRGVARLLDCFAVSAANQSHSERALRLAGAAAALRQNIGVSLAPAEQSRLDCALDPARLALQDTGGASVWLEGWSMPLEKAVEDVLATPAARLAP